MNSTPPNAPSIPVSYSSTADPAIGGLVCGVLGLLTLVTSLAAVILGHPSLSNIKSSGEASMGRGMAVAGLITGYLVIAIIAIAAVAGLVAPLIHRQRHTAQRTEMANHMKMVGLALLEYDQEFGEFPNGDTADTLMESTGSSVSPSDLEGPNILRQLEVLGMKEPLEALLAMPKGARGEWPCLPNGNSGDPPSGPILISTEVGRKRDVLRVDNSIGMVSSMGAGKLIKSHPDLMVVSHK